MFDGQAKPKISVVIPVYNRPETIGDAIRSVLNQSACPSEIIVIDDGSGEETREVIRAFENEITYIRQENKGVSAARNAGMDRARNEWIGFLDSDDEWEPTRIELLSTALSNPETVMSWNNSLVQGRDGAWWDAFARVALFPGDQNTIVARSAKFLLKGATYPSAICVRRELATKIGGFKVGLSAFEDQLFFVRLSQYGSTYVSTTNLTRICRKVSTAETLTDVHVAGLGDSRMQVINAFKELRSSEHAFTKAEIIALNERIANLIYDDVKSTMLEEGRLQGAKRSIGLMRPSVKGSQIMKCLAMLIAGSNAVKVRDSRRGNSMR